jgi:TIR domain
MYRPIDIFFSYAHKDEPLMNDVRRQLIVYERKGRILKWHDRQIPPGSDWRTQIDGRLNTAQIVLLFISPDFIESRYCYEIEAESALRRRESGEAEVIPIILRPCAWQETPFGQLQVLPQDGVPVTRWPDRDEACLNVATGVMAAVDRVIKGQEIKPKQSQSGLKALRIFAKGQFAFVDTKLDVVWDGKVVAQGSFRKGFNVTITDVSNGPHNLSVKFKGLGSPIKEQQCQINSNTMTNTVELVHSKVTGQLSWKFVRNDN